MGLLSAYGGDQELRPRTATVMRPTYLLVPLWTDLAVRGMVDRYPSLHPKFSRLSSSLLK